MNTYICFESPTSVNGRLIFYQKSSLNQNFSLTGSPAMPLHIMRLNGQRRDIRFGSDQTLVSPRSTALMPRHYCQRVNEALNITDHEGKINSQSKQYPIMSARGRPCGIGQVDWHSVTRKEEKNKNRLQKLYNYRIMQHYGLEIEGYNDQN